MTRFRKTVLIIVAAGWFVHHRGGAKPSLSEQIRGTQHLVDWLAFVGFSEWRTAHHAGCDETLMAIQRAMTVPRDAWHHLLRAGCSNSRVTVTSAGPDGVFDTEDDIASDRP